MPHVAARMASRNKDAGHYQRHRPEQTLLYRIVDEYYPAFAALMAEQGKELPVYVQREEVLPQRFTEMSSVWVEFPDWVNSICSAGDVRFAWSWTNSIRAHTYWHSRQLC